MTFFAGGTVPGVTARFSDGNDFLAGRAIPAIITDKVRKMMVSVRIAIPVMGAIFGLPENFVTECAKQFPAGTAGLTERARSFAVRTVPGVLTMFGGRIFVVAVAAVPMIGRASLFYGMMLVASGARPEMRAVFIFFDHFSADGTV